jgi:hypothetical protein
MDWLSSVVSSVSTFLVAAAMSVFSSTSSEPVYTILPIMPMNNTVAETIVYTTPDQIENESSTTLPIATIPASQPMYRDGVSSSDWRTYQAYTNDRFVGMIRYTNLVHQGESINRLDRLEKQLFSLMDDTSDSLQDIRDDNGGDSIDVTTLTGSTLVSPVFSGAIASNLILGSHYLSGDGGDEGIYIDGSGNVGIGTNSPTTALTVAGTAAFRDGLADASNSVGSFGMVLQSTGTSTRWVATSTLGLGGSSGLFTTDIDTSAKLAAILSDETGTGNIVFSASPTLTGTLNAAAATLSSTVTLSGSAANIALGSNYLSGDGGDEGISISNNGYVSIGTNLELAPLGIHSGAASTSMVIANTNSDARILFSNSTFTNFAGIGMNTNGLSLTGGGDTTLQPHLYINDSGNVGIGTTSALTKIDVVNTSNPASVLVRRTDGRSVRLSAASGESSVLFDNAGPFTIRGAARSSIDGNNATVGTVHLYMSGTGNVGLGTTTPEQVLSVVGNAVITGNILNAAWNGSTIGITYGGTGVTSYTTGDMLYKSAAAGGPLSKLPIGTAGQVLQVVGGVPAWVATSSLGIVSGSNFGSFVDVAEMAVANFGSFSCDGFACTVNSGAIDISSQTNLSVGATGLGLASDEIVLSSGFEIPRSASTSDWQTAYSWGDHATAGYALATTLSGYLPLTGGTLSGDLTFSGSTANIALGSNYLSGDGADEGLNIDTSGRIHISSLSGSVNPVLALRNTGSTVNSGNSLEFESGSSVEQASISQVITSVNNSDLYFATRGAGNLNEHMRITSVGNIGVGTTTPGAKLTVAGTGEFTDNLTFSGSSANIILGSNYLSGDGGDEGIYVDGSGNVGIGTATPVAKIHLEGINTGGATINNGNARFLMNVDGTNNPSIELHRGRSGFNQATALFIDWAWGNDSDRNARWIMQSSTKLEFTSTGALNYEFSNAGDVQITGGDLSVGTTTTSSKLTVAGDAYITGAFRDSLNSAGTSGMILQTTGAGTGWVATSSLGLSESFSNSSQLSALLTDETGAMDIGAKAVFSIAPTFTGLANFADIFATNATTTNATTTNLAISSLTSGRVPYITTSGRLIDSANLTFNGTSLTFGADAALSRGAANRLDLASGDSFNLASGTMMFGGIDIIRANTVSDSVAVGESAGLGIGNNTSMGYGAGRDASTTAGYNNVYVGYQSGINHSTGGGGNSVIGAFAGQNFIGSNNSFLGYGAGSTVTGSNNSFIGYYTGRANIGSYNEMIGYETGYNLRASSSVVIGSQALRGGSGFLTYTALNNIAIGYRAGFNATNTADNNILLGYQAADNLTTGNNNIIIGYDIDNVTATTDNALNIGNLIFGTGIDGTGTTLSSGNIGIGTSSPTSKLTVDGTILATNLLGGATNLTVDANGNIIRDPSDERLKEKYRRD